MHFCLLTRFHSNHNPEIFARRMVEEVAALGHQFELVNPEDVALQFGQEEPVRFRSGVFPKFDLVHYALRWDDDHAWSLVETLKSLGYCVLPPHRVPMGDSVTMTRLFARANITIPRTWVFSGTNQLTAMLGDLPFPCIFKVRKGGGGRKLFKANHTGEVLALAEQLTTEGHSFQVQEILGPTGQDTRAFIVGGQVVAAIERIAPEGFLWPREDKNTSATPTTLTPEETQMCVAATRVYGAPYAAVNFIRRPGLPPVLLELSRAPTLNEIERTTGINVAGAIAAFCASVARPPQL